MIGEGVPRTEDLPLVSGAGNYVDDIEVDDALHARFVRSPVAHGRIEGIESAEARSVDGVAAVFTDAEIDIGPMWPPIENPNAHAPSRPLLAKDVVRFVGEPVALVLAENPYVAEDAGSLVEVDVDPFEAVTDPVRAGAGEGPFLHEWDTNVLLDSTLEGGDVDDAFEQAAFVVERDFISPRYTAVPIEGRGLIAIPDGDGVFVWSSTQVPHRFRHLMSELLGWEPERIRIRCPDIGGGFGQKCHVYPEEVLTIWAAVKVGRPVRWFEDRWENLLSSSHARDQHLTVRAAADADGRLLGVEADVISDFGAYGVYPHGHILEALGTPALIPGPYDLQNYRARTRAVSTNKCPEGAYRGVGLVVSTFIHERLMDALAAEAGIDRAEIRRRNFITSEQMPYTSVTHQPYDSGDYVKAMEAALEAIDYAGFEQEREAARSQGRLLGLGISSYVEFSGVNSTVFQGRGMMAMAGWDGAHITLDDSGTANVWTTLPGIGQGVSTTFGQLVATQLNLPFERVQVENVDTGASGIDGTGTFVSRSAVAGGGAVSLVTEELRSRLVEAAGENLEVAVEDLELADGAVHVIGSPARRVEVADLVSADPEHYRVSREFDPKVAYPYATHACIIEVDSETGEIVIQRYVVVEDCGRIINPVIVDGQVHGAVAQGLGGALYEDFVYDPENGEPKTSSLMDYLIPGATEMPFMEILHQEIPAPDSPTGAKGVGEGGTLAPPAAIANALSDATGVEFNELPLTPERVLAATRSLPSQ
ncbi:MAG: xanthine dehydrogenase family protein molybdopterin-binding subunit [Solirubrobacterales bacterium]